jgi:hypothetical protein
MMDKSERMEKIELYGNGYELLVEALKDIPREMWKFKPAPSEWSVHEVLIHLADSEANAALRARMLIAEPGGSLMGYDQDRWAVDLDYHDQDTTDALETVKLVRQTTHALLKKQKADVFEHTVKHPEYPEPYTFEKWLDIYAAHIPGHIEQIRNNYRLWRDRQG